MSFSFRELKTYACSVHPLINITTTWSIIFLTISLIILISLWGVSVLYSSTCKIFNFVFNQRYSNLSKRLQPQTVNTLRNVDTGVCRENVSIICEHPTAKSTSVSRTSLLWYCYYLPFQALFGFEKNQCNGLDGICLVPRVYKSLESYSFSWILRLLKGHITNMKSNVLASIVHLQFV